MVPATRRIAVEIGVGQVGSGGRRRRQIAGEPALQMEIAVPAALMKRGLRRKLSPGLLVVSQITRPGRALSGERIVVRKHR